MASIRAALKAGRALTSSRAAAHPTQPAHSGRDPAATLGPPGRAGTPTTIRAGAGAAPRLQQRRGNARRPESRLGRVHEGKTVTIDVTDTELVIHCDDGVRTIRGTTDQPVARIKAHRPRKVDQQPKESVR
jgi:hypothetical protein